MVRLQGKEKTMIDHNEAMHIASLWHGGQTTAMYALASSGAVSPDLLGEIYRSQQKTMAPCLDRDTWEDAQLLDSLYEYVVKIVEDWEAQNPDAEDYPDYIYVD
jgi:hypothetical protein